MGPTQKNSVLTGLTLRLKTTGGGTPPKDDLSEGSPSNQGRGDGTFAPAEFPSPPRTGQAAEVRSDDSDILLPSSQDRQSAPGADPPLLLLTDPPRLATWKPMALGRRPPPWMIHPQASWTRLMEGRVPRRPLRRTPLGEGWTPRGLIADLAISGVPRTSALAPMGVWICSSIVPPWKKRRRRDTLSPLRKN